MKFTCMYFSIFYWKNNKINFNYNRLFCWNHTCYLVSMVSVTSASRYITSASRYHRVIKVDPRCTSVVWFHGIPRNWPRQFRLETTNDTEHRQSHDRKNTTEEKQTSLCFSAWRPQNQKRYSRTRTLQYTTYSWCTWWFMKQKQSI